MSLRLGLVAALALGAAGCAKDVCDRVSPCKNDPPQTQASRDACKATEKAAKGSPCFKETVSYAGCFNDNVVCGADGTTDLVETKNRTTTICSAQLSSFDTCCNANAGSASCQ